MRKGKKKIVLFMMSLALLGNTIAPMTVSAAEEGADAPINKEVVEDAVVYEEYDASELATYYGIKAPTMQGYYFGGWYENKPAEGETSDENCTAIMSLGQGQNDQDGKVYAKFVPNYMLNVKVQNSVNINTSGAWETSPNKNNKTHLRMISAIDSARYKEVGMHVFVGGNRLIAETDTKYYRTIYERVSVAKKNGEILRYFTAQDLFGLSSKNYSPKLITAKFENIPENGWKTSIFVRPYWITFDGIEVRGNGRYIHVEDGIKGYITVPVNLQNFTDKRGVVAGTLDVKYNSTKLEYIDVISGNKDAAYKTGIDLSTMAVKQSSMDVGEGLTKIKCAAIRKVSENNNSKKIMQKIVPNKFAAEKRAVDKLFSEEYKTVEQNSYENVNNMYVALRFKPTSNYEGVGDFLNFEISNTNFCDDNETSVSVDVWDVRY